MPLANILRGLYDLRGERYVQAIRALNLAQIYMPDAPFLHEKLAWAWIESGHPDAAETVVREGLDVAPTDPGLNFLAGQIALDANNRRAAIGPLSLAQKRSDLRGPAASAYIDALLWLGRPRAANAAVTTLLDEQGEDADLALALGQVLEDHDQLTGALTAYQQSRVQRPADRRSAWGEVRVLLLQGHPDLAADALAPLLSFYPDQPELYVALTRLLFLAGRPGGDVYRTQAVHLTVGDASGRVAIAVGDLLSGHVQAATTVLTDVLDEQPQSAEAHVFLANLHLRQEQPQICLAVLRDALAHVLDPLAATAALIEQTRASCYAALGDATAAAQALDHAWPQLEPQHRDGVLTDVAHQFAQASEAMANGPFQAWLAHLPGISADEGLLARAAFADAYGQGGKTLSQLRTVQAHHAEDAAVLLRLAIAEARYGDVAVAIEQLESLVQQDPFDVERLNALGFTLADTNVRLRDASVWLHRAHRLAPEDSTITDSLGWLFLRQGRLTDACTWLGRAAAAAPQDAEILRHLADAQRASGQIAQARATYQQALTHRPHPLLRRILQKRLSTL